MMVKTRDPTCCWDIFKTKGSNKEILLRMFGEEGGVAVVRNNSNNEQTPYISSKKPSTLPLNGAQTTNKHITAQPFHQKYSSVLNNSNNRNTIRSPYLALPINHRPSENPYTSTPQFNKTITGWDLCEQPLTLSLQKSSSQLLRSFSEI